MEGSGSLARGEDAVDEGVEQTLPRVPVSCGEQDPTGESHGQKRILTPLAVFEVASRFE